MKIAKLILLAFPLVVASALMLALPAAASINAPTTAQVTLVSAQPIPQSLTPLTQESNPIKDQLGCNCPSCIANSQLLQGKLPFANI